MLVVKDLTLQKLNESLHCKKNKKTKRNKVYADRKGRHLTHHESISALCKEQDVQEEAARQKEMRQEKRERGKVEKTRLELEWNAIKDAHVMSLL